MKKIIAIFFIFYSITMAFSQSQNPFEEFQHSRSFCKEKISSQSNNMLSKYHQEPLSLFFPDIGNDVKKKLWRPLRINRYSGEDHAELELSERHDYTYREGRLHQIDVKLYNTGGADSVVFLYNRTAMLADEDREDTVIYYQNGQKWLRQSYGYYIEDSLFLLTTIDQWVNGGWREVEKNYTYYWDTISWFNYKSLTFLYGDLIDGNIYTPEYDNVGNVSNIIRAYYNTNSKEFEISTKKDYFYDENGLCIRSDNSYYNKNNNTWRLTGSMQNMQWEEYHGFSNGVPLLFWPLGLYPELDNKLAYVESWHWNDEVEEFELFSVQKTDWNIADTIHALDTLWYFSELLDTLYPGQISECIMDPYGHYIYNYNINWTNLDENGSQEISYKNTTVAEYLYGVYGWYEYNWYRYLEYSNGEAVNTHYYDRYVVDSFLDDDTAIPILHPDKKQLSIIPNPAATSVILTSKEVIFRVDIFDMTGKLLKTESSTGSYNFVLDIGNIPKGIYLLRAQTENNCFRTGKLIVQ